MRRELTAFAMLAAGFAIAHIATLQASPGIIMKVAMKKIAETANLDANTFRLSPRVTPQSQTVVRPSPDFAYSICIYDLSEGSINLTVAPWPAYSSVSFFDAQTINFATVRAEKGADILLTREYSNVSAGPATERYVSPTNTGVILIRRLAPTEADYDGVASIAAGDSCAATTP
ncbi:MAG: DUF1254 domain-containing protein [Pseudomonadota bacterium]